MARRKSSTSSKASVLDPAATKGMTLVVQTAVSLVTLSLTVFAAQEELIPLFGGVATKLYLRSTVVGLIVSCAFLPFYGTLGMSQSTALSTLVCVAPPALHWLSTWTTHSGDPVLGPVLAYTPVLAPVVYLATDSLRGEMLLVSGWFVAAFGSISYTNSKNDPAATRKSRKDKLSLFILPLFATLLALSLPPTLPRPLPYAHPNGLLRILSSTPSVTGRIVVGEDYTLGFRFLRADHSLLGGVWIGNKHLVKMDSQAKYVRDKNSVKLGDSIYSAFVLQEAARLQERETPQKHALIIGLGAGIAAQAFIQHGLSTSIVEIDPAVYSAARDYFGLPEPYAAYIEDARSWVSRRAASKNGTYDIVVHDCFSGGGVPAHLFTSEFWEDLKKIVSPEGIVAVNYAGVVGSDSSRAVFLTLIKSFGQCRVFHDFETGLSDEKLTSEFINLVFFCSLSSKPLTFRPASRPDYLSSYLREHFLRLLPDREVRPGLILGNVPPEGEGDWVLTDARNPLAAWQDEGALDHWKVMRTVLPDYVWMTY